MLDPGCLQRAQYMEHAIFASGVYTDEKQAVLYSLHASVCRTTAAKDCQNCYEFFCPTTSTHFGQVNGEAQTRNGRFAVTGIRLRAYRGIHGRTTGRLSTSVASR